GVSVGCQIGTVLSGGLTPVIAASLLLAGNGTPWLICLYLTALCGLSLAGARRGGSRPRPPDRRPLRGDPMTTPILLNAFEMLVPAFLSPGLWRHPDDRSRAYHRLDHWTDLARTLEEGGFSGIFLADILGQYDVFGGDGAAAMRGGVQYPILDPSVI